MTKFYEIFKSLCCAKNTTPTAVLKQLKISTSKGTSWKNGSDPSIKYLIQISEFFNVSVDYLLGRENAQSNSNSITNNGNVISSTQSNNIVNSSDESKFDTTTTQVAEAFSNLSFSDKAKVMGLVAELEEQQRKKA